MTEEAGAKETVAEVTPTPAVDPIHGLTSTVDNAIVYSTDKAGTAEKTAQKTEGDKGDAEKAAKEAEAAKAKETDLDTRLDKHPRFKEVITSNQSLKAANQALTARLEVLESKPVAAQTKEEKAFLETFKNKEDMIDSFNEDPGTFLSTYGSQLTSQVEASVLSKVQEDGHQSKVGDTFAQYEEKNPDFTEKWASGEIKRFMELNPGHNAISAHMTLTQNESAADFDSKIEAAKAEAAKEATAKVLSDLKTKAGASTIPAETTGGQAPPSGLPPEMKDSSEFGGMTSVLLARQNARLAGRL